MKVKINTHGNALPECHGDFVDLATAEDVVMKLGEFKIISLGVSMELPEGCYAMVGPRSSTFKKWKLLLANSVGIIDNEYAGDDDVWGFPAIAFDDIYIPKGTRIAQFCIVKSQEAIEFEEVESLGNKSRGGFGSTGN